MFANKSDCWANCTVKVSDVPCVKISEGWICLCQFPWNWESQCQTNYFSDYLNISIAYVVLGLVLTIPATLLFSLDLALQFKHKHTINATFISKFFAIIYGLCRFGHYYEITDLLVTGSFNHSRSLLHFTIVIYWFADVLGIVIYFMITIMWLNLLLTLKNMSLEDTNCFTIAKTVYIIYSVIFIIGGVIFSVLLSVENKILYGIYTAWIGIPLFITVIFCFYNICKLSVQLENVEEKLKRKMKKKNVQLVWISIFLMLCFLELVAFQSYYSVTYSSVAYILFSLVLRILELITYYLFLIFIQKHLLKLFKKIPITNKSSTPQTKSTAKTTETEFYLVN